MTPAPAASALVPGARCAKHAERPATGVCSRCGDYLCGLCGRRVGDALQCSSCAERGATEHSRRAAQALVLGVCAVHGLFLLAPLALSLALRELSAIGRGEAPAGGRDLARVGLWLGSLGLAIPLSIALVWVALR